MFVFGVGDVGEELYCHVSSTGYGSSVHLEKYERLFGALQIDVQVSGRRLKLLVN